MIVLAAFWGAFSSLSVCTTCGKLKQTTEWQIPCTEVTYWEHESVTDTPLSRSLTTTGMVGEREHTWAFATGGGNGVMCAIGNGRYLLTAVRSEPIGDFLNAIVRYQDRDRAQWWRNALLDPKRSQSAATTILTSNVPSKGFANRPDFERWWQENAETLSLILSPAESEKFTRP